MWTYVGYVVLVMSLIIHVIVYLIISFSLHCCPISCSLLLWRRGEERLSTRGMGASWEKSKWKEDGCYVGSRTGNNKVSSDEVFRGTEQNVIGITWPDNISVSQ